MVVPDVVGWSVAPCASRLVRSSCRVLPPSHDNIVVAAAVDGTIITPRVESRFDKTVLNVSL